MFNKVIIDLDLESDKIDRESDFFDEQEYRLIPFLYLIADHIIESGPGGICHTIPNMNNKINFVERALATWEGRPNVLEIVKKNKDVIYFSPNKYRKGNIIKSQGITMQNSVLLLAASGLEITVPNFTFDIARSDEISSLRLKLDEERQLYLEAIAKMADETYQRITAGVYKDTIEWALSEAFIKIRPKAQAFERAVRKLDTKLLKRMALNFIVEGIPNIGSVTMSKGFKEACYIAESK